MNSILPSPKSLAKNAVYTLNRVSYVIAGAQKCGTTALHAFVGQHPDVCIPLKKELDFFSYYHDQGILHYHSYFPARFFLSKTLGEASPSYLYAHSVAAPRIKAYNNRMRVIFILRNPVDRFLSIFRVHRVMHRLPLSIDECIDLATTANPESSGLYRKAGSSARSVASDFLSFGRYSQQLATYLACFDRDQLLFLKTEDLSHDHSHTMSTVWRFLGLKPYQSEPSRIHSYSDTPLPDSDRARARLVSLYEQELSHLESMLGWCCSDWRA